jgi:hypothetical protein
MRYDELEKAPASRSSLQLLSQQPSHVLFALSSCLQGRESSFMEWYRGIYMDGVRNNESIVRSQYYEQHEVDITRGRYMRPPYRYLAMYQLSIDGAEQASGLIDLIHTLFRQCEAAEAPATWLFYPASEKVGRSPIKVPSMLTIAFANAEPGTEAEFREWYVTRHIRHALNISALVSGQCFERTQFQRPGAADCGFSMTAVYEQEGTPQEFLESYAMLPNGTLNFPMLDKSPGRFAECLYRPLV